MKKIVVSWSGGKDSCFVLDTLIRQGLEIVGLITTASKDKGRSFAHDLQHELLISQARSLRLPLYIVETDMKSYTEDFIKQLKCLKKSDEIEAIAFGDLYLDGHREWGESVAITAGIEALYPLWMDEGEAVRGLNEFIKSKYKAIITRVNSDKISTDWLGKEVDDQFYKAVQQLEICPMGESGEYHTLVIDGPLFHEKMKVQSTVIEKMDSTWMYDIQKFEILSK